MQEEEGAEEEAAGLALEWALRPLREVAAAVASAAGLVRRAGVAAAAVLVPVQVLVRT